MMKFSLTARTTTTTLAFVLLFGAPGSGLAAGGRREATVSRREELRDEVLAAFRHAYDSYMTHACES